jgi:hypothetical protein
MLNYIGLLKLRLSGYDSSQSSFYVLEIVVEWCAFR